MGPGTHLLRAQQLELSPSTHAAEAPDCAPFGPLEAAGEWFGLGKVRALALGGDGPVVERLLTSLE